MDGRAKVDLPHDGARVDHRAPTRRQRCRHLPGRRREGLPPSQGAGEGWVAGAISGAHDQVTHGLRFWPSISSVRLRDRMPPAVPHLVVRLYTLAQRAQTSAVVNADVSASAPQSYRLCIATSNLLQLKSFMDGPGARDVVEALTKWQRSEEKNIPKLFPK